MRYFRYYPWGFQLLLFMLMVFTMLWFGVAVIGALLPVFTGVDMKHIIAIDANSPRALVDVFVIVQGLSNIFIFLVPALLFAYLAHPRPAGYLGLRAPGRPVHPLLAILIMVGAAPALAMVGTLVSHIDFGPDVRASQEAGNATMSAILDMPDPGAFIKTFIVMAIVPGMGEELFFRGVMLRFARKRSQNMVFPILFSAAVFAAVHTNVYGYLSIFLAGVLLALIYNLTGSLWCSIAGHVFFNGTQITAAYMGNTNPVIKAYMAADAVPYPLIIGGLAVSAISFWLLLKSSRPLPPGWEGDFAPGEIAEKAA